MCAVSAVFDYGRRFPNDYWTWPRFDEFKKLVEGAKEFDKKTGQPDCEDPAKADLLRQIMERLERIEKRLGPGF